MRLLVGFRSFRVAVCLAVCGAVPSAAHADPLVLIGGQLPSALAMLVQAGSLCVTYTYDKNGNRVAQTSFAIGSGVTTWGSGTYGCFMWAAQ